MTAISIDFSGTSPVSGYGINVPLTYTDAYASFGVRCIVGGDIPNNWGSLDPIRVDATGRGGPSILNAPHPCGVAARHVIGQMLPDVVLGLPRTGHPRRHAGQRARRACGIRR